MKEESSGGPPPLAMLDIRSEAENVGAKAPTRTSTAASVAMLKRDNDDGPTLMERMLQDSAAARKALEAKKKKQAAKSAKASFGDGFAASLRRGLSGKKKKKAKTKKKSAKQVSVSAARPVDVIEFKTKEDAPARGVLPEVQKAMQESAPEWANDDLAKKMQSDPVLSKAMRDPRFASALNRIAKDPQVAMQEMARDPALKNIMGAFAKVMGEHFTALGEAQEAETAKSTKSKQETPLIQIQTAEEAEMDRNVNKVLENAQVRAILQDPETRGVLQKCGEPGALARFMNDPKWGPRLRILADMGLVRIEK